MSRISVIEGRKSLETSTSKKSLSLKFSLRSKYEKSLIFSSFIDKQEISPHSMRRRVDVKIRFIYGNPSLQPYSDSS